MNPHKPLPVYIPINRRRFFSSMAAASAGFTLPGFLAEALTQSPIVTQGPYYPLADDIPLDKDNDLVQLGDSLTAATGIVTYVSGRVLDSSGNPVRNALVECWHADHEGDYAYSTGTGRNSACDPNFAGFGQFITGSSGAFRFRTIKAGLYNGRTRHFHWGVTLPGRTTRSCTQTAWNETAYANDGTTWATQNSNDSVFASLSAAQKASVFLDFAAVEGTTTGEVAANWDFVSGFTPVEPTYPAPGGFVVAGEAVAGPDGTVRFKLVIPAYANYCYEIYGNPSLADLEWKALPFSLTQIGSIDRNKFVATQEGSLSLYVDTAASRGFYKVSFRVPGANIGTP
jgi:protocatechuate 3,4-dioxygenase beta subunit